MPALTRFSWSSEQTRITTRKLWNYLKPIIIMMSGFMHTYLLNAFLTICMWIDFQLNWFNRLMRHIIIDDAIKIIESSLVELKFEFWIIIILFLTILRFIFVSLVAFARTYLSRTERHLIKHSLENSKSFYRNESKSSQFFKPNSTKSCQSIHVQLEATQWFFVHFL